MKIKFGTDGWRGIIAKDFTFDNVAVVSQAIAEWMKKNGKKSALVGYDTRFLSREFAESISEVLAGNEIYVTRPNSYSPTPEVSWSVQSLKIDIGLMITASHNPYYYNGIKIKDYFGGPADSNITSEIEKLASGIMENKSRIKRLSSKEARDKGLLKTTDSRKQYIEHILKLIDTDRMMKNPQKVVIDSMYGAGSG